MPANLPPMYFEAEKRFRDGKTAEDKIEALEDIDTPPLSKEHGAETKTSVPLLTLRRCVPIFLPYR